MVWYGMLWYPPSYLKTPRASTPKHIYIMQARRKKINHKPPPSMYSKSYKQMKQNGKVEVITVMASYLAISTNRAQAEDPVRVGLTTGLEEPFSSTSCKTTNSTDPADFTIGADDIFPYVGADTGTPNL